MAQSVAAFWEEQTLPPPEEKGAILVCTADGKGVPTRRETAPNKPPVPASSAHAVTDKPPQEAPAPSMAEKDLHPSGPRAGTKKMALLGAVYTINPVIRTPEEVLETLCSPAPSVRDTKRPKPCHKHMRAALERDGDDTTAPQVTTIFDWIGEQAQARNPSADKPIVLLMDGQESLWNAGWEALSQRDEEVTEVLDLMHALGYLWDVARVFYPKAPSGPEAVAFVQQQAGRLLHGQVETVLRSLRWLSTHHALTGKRLEQLETICGYFHNNAHRMDDATYLEHGFPIASGVIEGACRCVVKDRMEGSWMRWVMSGARAMLNMRCIALSDLWDAFKAFRIQRESRRLYPGFAANDADFTQAIAA